MATIKLNPIITDIRNRMGSNVFSKWKGINYVRGYVPPTNRNTKEQAAVRSTFSRLVEAWKSLGTAIQQSWNALATGTNMSGYNAFISENFESMKADLALILSKSPDEEPAGAFTAAPGAAAGEISCAYPSPAAGREITLFTQKKSGDGNGPALLTRHDTGGAASPFTVGGLEPGSGYHVYAVITEGPYAEAKQVSASVSTDAVAKA